MNFFKNDVGKIILFFIVWRIFLFAAAFVSPNIISDFGARFPYYQERLISTGLPHFLWSFGNFDGVHYLGIAKDAYAAQFTQAFFPFYPILIRLFSYLTFGNLIIAALLVSNLAFLASLLIFYNLIKKSYSTSIATWSCLFLLAFPTSFYFGAVYTEGLFFLLIISSFYFASRGNLMLASIIGALASFTRLAGIFLVPALITKTRFKSMWPLVIPIGLLLYVIYLQLEFKNPLYFLTAQSIFGQERSTTTIVLLPQVIWRYLKIFATAEGQALLNASFELILTTFAFILLYLSFKRVKIEWVVFSVISIVLPTLTGTLASMPRYVLVAFPIFIVLAQIQNTLVKSIILIISATILLATTIFFTQGYWVA